VLFGDYKGTVKQNGFYWVNPLFVKKPISLRARNFDSEKIKVNDKVGNPIQIGVILVWQVQDTFKAAFEVDNYENFVKFKVILPFVNWQASMPMTILKKIPK
jgi:regulator of protease activity HflC (stomatin/prohibitin superfamily)